MIFFTMPIFPLLPMTVQFSVQTGSSKHLAEAHGQHGQTQSHSEELKESNNINVLMKQEVHKVETLHARRETDVTSSHAAPQ